MIPLTESLQMAFRSVISTRPKGVLKNAEGLTPFERGYIKRYLKDNSPAFTISDSEIYLLFRSFQRSRFHKKKKQKAEQMTFL